MSLVIEAPTDAQLGYIASLCREHGLQQPRGGEGYPERAYGVRYAR